MFHRRDELTTWIRIPIDKGLRGAKGATMVRRDTRCMKTSWLGFRRG